MAEEKLSPAAIAQASVADLERETASYVYQSKQPTHDLEAIRQARHLTKRFGSWLEESLTKDAANIYLLVDSLKRGGGVFS